jgi:hypothetical protein
LTIMDRWSVDGEPAAPTFQKAGETPAAPADAHLPRRRLLPGPPS